MRKPTQLLIVAICVMIISGFTYSKLPPLVSISDPRVILISGEIGEDTADRFVSDLKRLDSINNVEIEIDISSYGGSVYAGLKIIDAMRLAKSPIKTVCEGYCMSMGAFILASGSKGRRFSMPNATILMHQVSGGMRGTISDLENTLKEAKRLQGVIIGILQQTTGLNEEQLLKVMDHDNYMTPITAKELHLIDDIISE